MAARLVGEQAIDLRYRLRMLGVQVIGPTVLFGDNQGVMYNISQPHSTLKKRHQAVAYHQIRELVTGNVLRFMWCKSEVNLADVGTKTLGTQIHLRLLHNQQYPPLIANVRECQLGMEAGAKLGLRAQAIHSGRAGCTTEGHWNTKNRLRRHSRTLGRSLARLGKIRTKTEGWQNSDPQNGNRLNQVFQVNVKPVEVLWRDKKEWVDVPLDAFCLLDKCPLEVKTSVRKSRGDSDPGKTRSGAKRSLGEGK